MAAGPGVRALTGQVKGWLQGSSLELALAAVASLPPAQAIKPLFSCLCSTEPLVKWQAVVAMGQTVATLAKQEMEAARVVMRRCLWMLNDESGGIGWGVPEAMGEVLACHSGLAAEYTHCLVAFMREDGFFLELAALQQGLLWGIAREAEVYPQLLRAREAGRYLLPYLPSPDPLVKGLACLALGRLGEPLPPSAHTLCQADQRPLTIYQAGAFLETTVSALAEQALARCSSQGTSSGGLA